VQPPQLQSVQLLQVTVELARYLLDRSHAIQKFVESLTQNAIPGPLPLRVWIEISAFATPVFTHAGALVVPSLSAVFELI
jgi:hypothetical protein